MLNRTLKLTGLMTARNKAISKIQGMSKAKKEGLEFHLDVEHAYYSSALEGSRIDRKMFDHLAKKVRYSY